MGFFGNPAKKLTRKLNKLLLTDGTDEILRRVSKNSDTNVKIWPQDDETLIIEGGTNRITIHIDENNRVGEIDGIGKTLKILVQAVDKCLDKEVKTPRKPEEESEAHRVARTMPWLEK
jgi:hypothetical protein